MKCEEHILVNFPIDTSLKKKAHSAMTGLKDHFPSAQAIDKLNGIQYQKMQNKGGLQFCAKEQLK